MVTVSMQAGLKSPSAIAVKCTFKETLPEIVAARFEFAEETDAQGAPTFWTATPSERTDASIIASYVFAADGSDTAPGTKTCIVWLVDGSSREYPSQRFLIKFQ